MFKDIGVSVPCLWYKRVCSRLSSFYLDLVYVRHLCVGLNPGRSSFCWINHAGISGDWEKGHVEGETHQHRFIWTFQNFPGFHLHSKRRCQCVSRFYYSFDGDVNYAIWFSVIFFFFFFLAAPCGMRDLSSPTRDSNPCPLHWECGGLTTGPPGKSLQLFSCAFTNISRSILRYPLSSHIIWDMSSMKVLVVFVREYLWLYSNINLKIQYTGWTPPQKPHICPHNLPTPHSHTPTWTFT